MLSIIAAIILFQLSSCIAGDPCPPKNELAPCTCTFIPSPNSTTPILRPSRSIREVTPDIIPSPIIERNSSLTIVDCKVPKTINALVEAVSSALHRKEIDKLIVSNVPPAKEHTLARLPSQWLMNVRVKQFEIRDTILSGDFIWSGNPFQGQAQSLRWFAANKCYLSGTLTYDTVGTVNTRGLPARVEGVDLSFNHLSVITNTAFKYPPANLSSIILARNSLQSIESSAFQYVPKLRNIDLSHNLLEGVLRNIFASPSRYLQYIDLSWNLLTSLPVDFFTNMPALISVNLSKNFLFSLPEKPWSQVWRQLTYINLTGNYIECNCDLLWLLPIISPSKVNVTTTPVPTALPGQIVLGECSRATLPRLLSTKYNLTSLTRDKLTC